MNRDIWFLYAEYRDVFRANLTSKIEFSAKKTKKQNKKQTANPHKVNNPKVR